jgi:uncharacterized protein YecE (DUF72 family)
VEGNTTFYALPSPEVVARWVEQTPPSFRFCCKLPRSVTHERRLRDAGADVAAFCERLEPLGERIGPTSVQLPASFGPDDLGVLDAFLTTLPGGWPWAVEVRHPAFFAGGAFEAPLDELLRAHGVDRVVLDSRALFSVPLASGIGAETQHRKPQLPVRPTATATRPVVRFIGLDDPEANPPFWAKWIPKLASWLDDGLEPFVFLHTPDNLWSPVLARRLHAEVTALVPDLEPLPPAEPPGAQPALW